MNISIGAWNKLRVLVMFLLFSVLLWGIIEGYRPIIQQNQRLRRDIFQLKQDIQKEAAAAEQLQVAISALKDDPKTVERFARERLGYAKPGETVVRFESPGKAAAYETQPVSQSKPK